MSKTPFMPLWVSDFLGKTMHLDAKEVGAYMLLLMALWGRGGALPNDPKKLQRIARVGRDWPTVWASLEGFFTVDGDQITQGRLSEELHKVNAKREVNAHSGARGGRAKALKSKEVGLANATVSLKQPEPYPYTEDTDVSSVTRKPRKRQIKADEQISEAMRRAADKRGHSQQEAEAQFERFHNDALAKGKAFVDWDRAFITWLDSPYFKPITTGDRNGRETGAERAKRIAAMCEPGVDRREGGGSVVPLLSARQPD